MLMVFYVMDIAKETFNIGFVGAIMALAYEGKFVLEVFAFFKKNFTRQFTTIEATYTE